MCYLCFGHFKFNEEERTFQNAEYYKMLPFHRESCLLEAQSNTNKYQLLMDLCNHYQMFTYDGDTLYESVIKQVMTPLEGKVVEAYKVFYYKSKLIAFIKTESELYKITSNYSSKDSWDGDECTVIPLNDFTVYLELFQQSKEKDR